MCHYFTRDPGETFQTAIVWLILSPTSSFCRSAHLPPVPACLGHPAGQGRAGLWAVAEGCPALRLRGRMCRGGSCPAAPRRQHHVCTLQPLVAAPGSPMSARSFELLIDTSCPPFPLSSPLPGGGHGCTSLAGGLAPRQAFGWLGTASWEGRRWQTRRWDFGVISMVQTWVGSLHCASL